MVDTRYSQFVDASYCYRFMYRETFLHSLCNTFSHGPRKFRKETPVSRGPQINVMEKLQQDPSVPNSALHFVWIRISVWYDFSIIQGIFLPLSYFTQLNKRDLKEKFVGEQVKSSTHLLYLRNLAYIGRK